MSVFLNNIPILVQDNFLPNCDEVRNFALKQEYECRNSGKNWRGYRTEEITVKNSLTYQTSTKIYEAVKNFYNMGDLQIGMQTYFHYTTEETKLHCLPSFDEFKLHRDINKVLLAGVLYLHPKPKSECGTILIDEVNGQHKYLENVYNRLVSYPGNILHGPNDLFGDSIETGRLTITFFLAYPH